MVENPNGIVTEYVYDAASHLRAILHKNSDQSIAGATYQYDAAGNKTSETRYEGNTRSFGYDENDRLTQSSNDYWPAEDYDETFAYDLNGNWTPYEDREHNAANQLIEDSNYIYTYDEEGCLILKRNLSDSSDATYYYWNVQNQLVSVDSPSMTAIFTYDAFGRRIGKTVDGIETRYLYDGQNVRLESEGGVSWTHAMTSSGIDQWLCREDLETGEQLFYHTDGANSTIAVTDETGSVVERYIYSAYGKVDTLSPDLQTRLGGPSQPYTYTGREWDNGPNIYHYRARYYDPSMGRFISCDPIGIAGGLNLYAYANNNPMKWLDPMGLSPATVSGAGPKVDPSKNGLTANDLKNLPYKIKRQIDKALGETLKNSDHREHGGIVEKNKKGEFRNYPDKPFEGPPYNDTKGGVVVIEDRGPLGDLWNKITGWEAAFDWHTHPENGAPSQPPTYPSDYPSDNVPSVVFSKETVYIVNPGAKRGQYTTMPTKDFFQY